MLTNRIIRSIFYKNNLCYHFITKEKKFIKNRTGAILIPFIVLLPFFIALLFLSFEISQFLQKKAKLSDAIEQATLALTVENNDLPDEVQSRKNIDLVTQYSRTYLPLENFLEPKINIENNCGQLVYNAKITMSYFAKFLSQTAMTNKITTISTEDNGAARKYIVTEKPELTDVVFVADYSGSMNDHFDKDSSDKSKKEVLADIFSRLHTTIFENKYINTIGFVPFTWGTKNVETNNGVSKTYCHFPFVPKKHRFARDYLRQYSPANLKQFLKPESFHYVENIEYGKLSDDSYNQIKNEISTSGIEFLDRTYNINDTFTIFKIIEKNIDYDKTIQSISNKYGKINIPINDVLGNGFCLQSSNNRTLKFDEANDENITYSLGEKTDGGTLVSSGILAANNVFKEKNSTNKKLMVILSDGDDSNPTNSEISNEEEDKDRYHITQELISEGMCEAIAGNNIRMVFIAIGYEPEANKNSEYFIDWEKCVGKENFYLAKNAHQLETELQQILERTSSSEVGRNIPKH